MNLQQLAEPPKTLLVPQGEFELQRKPRDPRLQAWDAADEFLLQYVDETRLLTQRDRVLILNDGFGALATALAGHEVFSWNDSLLAQQALADNLLANGYPADQVRRNSGIDLPSAAVDCVVIKLPKSLALLEYQLYALRPILHHDTRIAAAGMARHIHNSTLLLFESILGPTTTTRARKKARLILTERDFSLSQGENPYPDSYELQLDRCYRLVNHASLFSRDRLDRGSRLLLSQIKADPDARRIADLGCGNGVLGIVAAARNPEAEILFCDESFMAIASARQNFEAAFGAAREAEFRVIDCLQGVDPDSRDLVLINPPFHQQHQVGDAVAWQMLKQSRQVLCRGGTLLMVGNRHLGYHAKLKKLFGNCSSLASDSKFVVLKAVK